MPLGPKPLPYELRMGVDICKISRVAAIIHRGLEKPDSTYLTAFLRRILHLREVVPMNEWLLRRRMMSPNRRQLEFAKFLAGRYVTHLLLLVASFVSCLD
jgi:phosphopantetheinyl transferase (holo-ACP synthase)